MVKPAIILLFIIINNIKSSEIKLCPKWSLNDGNQMPIVSLGTWQLVHDRPKQQSLSIVSQSQDKVIQTVAKALEAGYRSIDTAYCYNNEIGIGQAIKNSINSGQVKREDLFIITKVWNTFHTRKLAVENIKLSLKDLGLSYVDLVLIHLPMGFLEGDIQYPVYENLTAIPNSWQKDSYIDTWRGLEDAKREGLTKSIGVSNFNINQMKVLLEKAEIKPTINQVECNPLYNQNQMLEYLNGVGVQMMAFSPIRRSSKDIINEPILLDIAKKYNKTLTQIALRWNIQRGVFVAPKSTNTNYLLENLNVFGFNITNAEMDLISNLPQKPKLLLLENARNHPDYPFSQDLAVTEKPEQSNITGNKRKVDYTKLVDHE